MPELSLQIHPSIRIEEFPNPATEQFQDGIILKEAIIEIVRKYPKMTEIILDGDKLKPGLLYFSSKTELKSMGLLNEPIESDLSVRIVPILHGG